MLLAIRSLQSSRIPLHYQTLSCSNSLQFAPILTLESERRLDDHRQQILDGLPNGVELRGDEDEDAQRAADRREERQSDLKGFNLKS